MRESLTKTDLKLALDTFTNRLTIRLGSMIVASFAAMAVVLQRIN